MSLLRNPEKSRELAITVADLGNQEYGLAVSVNGEFAGGSDISGDKELFERVEELMQLWLNKETRPVRPRRRRR